MGVADVRVDVVCLVEGAEPGIDMTEAVRVAVDAKSASLSVICPTGVKALISLL